MILNCSKHECRWKRRKDARPEEILEAALELFAEKGFSSARMCDVAKQAGISKGTLYLYFDSKEAIFLELVKTIITPMVDEAEKAIKEYQGSSTELLQEFLRRWWQQVWNSKLSAIPKLVFSEAGNFPEIAVFYTETIIKRVRGLLENIIRQGIADNEFKDCDVTTTTRLLMAPVIQANIWKHSLAPYDADLDPDLYIKQHIEIFLSGLKKENTHDH